MRASVFPQSVDEDQDVVLSIDYDGCWDWEFNEENAENSDLPLNMLAQSANAILVGSNRQSYLADKRNKNSKNNGSCFERFQAYDKFYPLLAADIQRNQSAGYTLGEDNTDNFEYIADDDKRTLLYSQIHAIATLRQSQGLSGDFVFKFVDDIADIIEALNVFFTTNPDFIPEGVTLQLFEYRPGREPRIQVPQQFEEDIYGTGMVDANYVNTSNAITQSVDRHIELMDPTPILDTAKKIKDFYNPQRPNVIRRHRDIIAFDYAALKTEASAQFEPMVDECIAVSSKYSRFQYNNAEVVSPHKVSYKVMVSPQAVLFNSSVTLHLLFTYDSRTESWDVEPSEDANENEADDRNEFFYSYVDSHVLALQPSPKQKESSDNDTQYAEEKGGLFDEDSDDESRPSTATVTQDLLQPLLQGDAEMRQSFSSEASEDQESQAVNFEYCYNELIVLLIEIEEVIQEVSSSLDGIFNKLEIVFFKLDDLEEQVFELLKVASQKGYLDNASGSLVDQLVQEDCRSTLTARSSTTEIFDPTASTVRLLEEYRSSYVGEESSRKTDCLSWRTSRLNVVEGLLGKASLMTHYGDSDDCKQRKWLYRIRKMVSDVATAKESLVTVIGKRKNDSLLTSKNQFTSIRCELDWLATFQKMGQLNEERSENGVLCQELEDMFIQLTFTISNCMEQGFFSPTEKTVLAAWHGIDLDTIERLQFNSLSNQQISNVINFAQGCEYFQFRPSQLDSDLKQLPQTPVSDRPKLPGLQGLSLGDQREPKRFLTRGRLTFAAGIVGMATMAVLTVGSFGIIPGAALLGGLALWQTASLIAAPAVPSLFGWISSGISKISNFISPSREETLIEKLNNCTPEQLLKAFFSSPANEEVRDIVENNEELFERMIECESVLKQQAVEFESSLFTGNGPSIMAITAGNHIVDPCELANYCRKQLNNPDRLALMLRSSVVKKELAVFLVHSVLCGNATQGDRQCALSLLANTEIQQVLLNKEEQSHKYIKGFVDYLNSNDDFLVNLDSIANDSRSGVLSTLCDTCFLPEQRFARRICDDFDGEGIESLLENQRFRTKVAILISQTMTEECLTEEDDDGESKMSPLPGNEEHTHQLPGEIPSALLFSTAWLEQYCHQQLSLGAVGQQRLETMLQSSVVRMTLVKACERGLLCVSATNNDRNNLAEVLSNPSVVKAIYSDTEMLGAIVKAAEDAQQKARHQELPDKHHRQEFLTSTIAPLVEEKGVEEEKEDYTEDLRAPLDGMGDSIDRSTFEDEGDDDESEDPIFTCINEILQSINSNDLNILNELLHVVLPEHRTIGETRLYAKDLKCISKLIAINISLYNPNEIEEKVRSIEKINGEGDDHPLVGQFVSLLRLCPDAKNSALLLNSALVSDPRTSWSLCGRGSSFERPSDTLKM